MKFNLLYLCDYGLNKICMITKPFFALLCMFGFTMPMRNKQCL